jgi:hypothetical protein
LQAGVEQKPPAQTPLTQSAAIPQALVLAHLVAQLPPQSTSDSLPFLTTSVQSGAAQMFALQTPLAQSPPTAQNLAFAHFAQVPPQSTSDSRPNFFPTVHAGTAQNPPVQTWLVQSAEARQILPSVQGVGQLPPQSTSVSLPFFTKSTHAAVEQVFAAVLQTPLRQSLEARHPLAFAHFVAQLPPQSTSVSVPFFTTSVQSGAEHVFAAALQTPFAQSPPSKQPLAFAHFVEQLPPQSTSVSLPFFTTSVQSGALQVLVAPSQMPLAQSVATAQVARAVHFAQLPPQSTSVSLPFLTASAHPAPTQVLPEQTFVVQSAAPTQAFPSAQGPQLPPQSTSVSVPFLTTSVQLVAAQTPPVQAPVEQSPATAHFLLSSHFFGHEPPQSTSVSDPFFTTSAHVAAGGAAPSGAGGVTMPASVGSGKLASSPQPAMSRVPRAPITRKAHRAVREEARREVGIVSGSLQTLREGRHLVGGHA